MVRMMAFTRRGGFTLLEMLVVLAIMALITSVTLPNLQRLSERVSFAAQRADLIAQIDQLAYRSFVTGSTLDLSTDSLGQPMKDGQPAIRVPDGWRLTVPRPVHYGIDGFCSGGVVVVAAPDGDAETFTLAAPRCRAAENAS